MFVPVCKVSVAWNAVPVVLIMVFPALVALHVAVLLVVNERV